MSDKQQFKHVIVAQIGRPHGYRGWFKIHSFTDPSGNLLEYLPLTARRSTDSGQHIEALVEIVKPLGHKIIGKLDGINDEYDLKPWVNTTLSVPETRFADLSHTYYWHELIGLSVIDHQGKPCGIVDHLFETGANDVIVIKHNQKTYAIPYIDSVIIHVDLEGKTIQIDWHDDDAT